MKVLVACEFSGIVRDAFIARGHDAISCDLLPTERTGPHVQGDVLPLLRERWDLVIAHPPCTYLCVSGVTCLHEMPGPMGPVWENRPCILPLSFFLNATQILALVACENPTMHKYATGGLIGSKP